MERFIVKAPFDYGLQKVELRKRLSTVSMVRQ